MNLIFHGEVIDYEFINNKSDRTILFLHGWGGNKNSFKSTINLLKRKFNILTLTMPTIQNTQLVWDMFDYKNLVLTLLYNLNIKYVYIVCHSFGFRVASLLNNFFDIKKIIVTGGAGIKKTSIFKKISIKNNKILLKNNKFSYIFKNIASADYLSLSITNRETFKKVVNLNTKNFVQFTCPTLLFWGTKDKETPIWISKFLHKRNNAKLIKTKGGHFAYIEQNSLFNNSVLEFFND